MTTDPRWALAICLICKPVLPQPFSYAHRDEAPRWAAQHVAATGHTVALAHTCGECRRLVCHPACPGQDLDHYPWQERTRLAFLRPAAVSWPADRPAGP